MKKLITVLLVLAMLVSVIACSKEAGGNKETTNGITTEPTVTKDPDSLVLPEKTFDGMAYRISTLEGNLTTEVFADESAGTDIRTDSLIRRNAMIEDTYDVVIEPVISTATGSAYAHVEEIINLALSEEDQCDIALTYAFASGNLVTTGVTVNWLDFDSVDFSKSYWINDVNQNLIIDDAVYTVVGDMCISSLILTYGMFYNRTVGDRTEGLTESIFEAIENGEWTIDYFNDIVKDIYDDVDDVPGRSAGDFYGFTAESLTNLDIWQFAFDIPMIVHNSEGGLDCVFNTERTSVAVDKINRLYWENTGSSIHTSNACTKYFAQGKALFHTAWLDYCFWDLRGMEDNYTILPYPMFDENQEKYMSGAMDNYNVITMPYTCPNKDDVAFITEAMNYYSRQIMYPAYYEESLQKQFTRDPETVEMLDLIMDGRSFDLGTIFNGSIGGIGMMFRGAVSSKTNDFAKYYAQSEEAINNGLKSLIETYEANKMN